MALTPIPSAEDLLNQRAFQARVEPWMLACFGSEIAADRVERNHRFLEEALELVQSLGCTQDEAHQLVRYVYGRPAGEPSQEVGGTMVTLAALCLAAGLDMHAAAELELARINVPETIERIRAKQASKPKGSPLPSAPDPARDAVRAEIFAERRRQVSEEGWQEEHDDAHADFELTKAAECYEDHALGRASYRTDGTPVGWPWETAWWKPKEPRRDLIRAGALYLAEMDRLKRCGFQDQPAWLDRLERVVDAVLKLDGGARG